MSDCWNFGNNFLVDFQEVQPWNLNLWLYKLKKKKKQPHPLTEKNKHEHEVIARAVRIQVGQGVSGQLFWNMI